MTITRLILPVCLFALNQVVGSAIIKVLESIKGKDREARRVNLVEWCRQLTGRSSVSSFLATEKEEKESEEPSVTVDTKAMFGNFG